jgi:hypothetical protein
VTTTGSGIAGRFSTRSVLLGLLLQIASIGIICFEVQSRLVPAVARDVTFATFHTAARLVLDAPNELPNLYRNDWFNDQLHRHGFPHLRDVYFGNPPTTAALLTPLALLPVTIGRVVWAVVNLAALIGGMAALLRALRIPLRWTAPLVALAALTAPVGLHFERNQLYLMLFGLLCWLISAWLNDRRRWSGVALGILLTFKTAGAWLFLARFVRRDWVFVGAAAGVAAALVVALLPITGIDVWRTYLSHLPQLVSMPMRYVTAYQTLAGLVGHLFVFDPQWNPRPLVDLPVVASVLSLTIFLASLLVSLRCEPPPDAPRSTRAVHLAMLLALVVTNTPFAEDYHYVLVLPSLIVAWWWFGQDRPGPFWMSSLAVATLALMAPLPYKHPLLADGALAVFAYPRVYGAFLLWGWLLRALSREKRKQPEAHFASGRATSDLL